MKSILIVGMGKFGHHLTNEMARLGNEIMIVDIDEEKMRDLLPVATGSVIGDCSDPEVLSSLGIGNYDICFVCIGTNFQSSLEVTSLLKEMGAKYVVSKANRDIHAKFLLRNGADEVIYPDRDIAERTAVRFSANHVYDYIELSNEYAICEIKTPVEWIGKTLSEAQIRTKYNINVLGINDKNKTAMMPFAEYRMQKDEHMMIVGKREDISRLLKLYKR